LKKLKKSMSEELENIFKENFCFRPNRNQLRDIKRLIFEIEKKENIKTERIIADLTDNVNIKKYAGKDMFLALKNLLIKRRFPLSSHKEKIDPRKVFLNEIKPPIKNNWQVKKEFKPIKIFIEKEIKNSFLLRNFREKFTSVNIEEIDTYSEYVQNNKFNIAQLKKPLVFIIKEKWDFLKRCPCTKLHLPCGYWILNLGFGCPFDCSYCFLQQYTNFPGIILPANIEKFFEKFDRFSKKIKRPIRIGTGEFCDSLALDPITEYSKLLIPYFSKKNVLFELKTKSTNINNILSINPSKNIIISWSLNPQSIIKTEEKGTPSLKERLLAAKKIQKAGFSLAFHFDPIIYTKDWKKYYKKVIDTLYTCINPSFAWISLGTLRGNRGLKTVSEARFPKSSIFYGELLLAEDKKLRYPEFLRKEIYQTMVKYIKEYDNKTPLYLCMENKNTWSSLKKFSPTKNIENYLLGL